MIEAAESKLADTSVEYTQDSVSRLESSLNNLKTIKDAYTTGEDKMIEDITKNYGTENDRIKGYGSIANSEDKDVLANGKTANRLKQGESSLLDKTIYTQLQKGEVVADAKLPVVSADTLETAKAEVVNAISALTVKQDISDTNMPDVPSDDEAEANGAPKTGDSIMTSVIYGSALVLSLGTVYVAFRKKEEENC